MNQRSIRLGIVAVLVILAFVLLITLRWVQSAS